jgi:hypothetical protein
MSFDITLYRNDSPKNQAVKTLSQILTLTGTLKTESSIVDPVVLIEYDAPINFNYFKIPSFNDRYYFVEDIVSVGTKLWELHGHCDVLSSFWSTIRQCDCIISRSGTNRRNYMVDPMLMTTVKSKFGIQKSTLQPLASGTALKRFVMVLVGSGAASTPST